MSAGNSVSQFNRILLWKSEFSDRQKQEKAYMITVCWWMGYCVCLFVDFNFQMWFHLETVGRTESQEFNLSSDVSDISAEHGRLQCKLTSVFVITAQLWTNTRERSVGPEPGLSLRRLTKTEIGGGGRNTSNWISDLWDIVLSHIHTDELTERSTKLCWKSSWTLEVRDMTCQTSEGFFFSLSLSQRSERENENQEVKSVCAEQL